MTRLILSLFAVALMLCGAAQAADDPMRVRITNPGGGMITESIDLAVNKAAVVELPQQARDVLVANPAIADAVIRTPRQVYLLGMTVGRTNIFFFDGHGEQILDLQVNVVTDLSDLQAMLDKFVPGSVEAAPVNDRIVLTGAAPSSAAADQALKLAQSWVEQPENVYSMISITGKEQVMLKVRVVEMQRTIVKQLGVNLFAEAQSGEVSFAVANEPAFPLVGRFLGGTRGRAGYTNPDPTANGLQSLTALVEAMEGVGLIRTLAEPNLTAISGEESEFLAGGEFPVPVGRDDDGNIIIEFKPFGVGLGFTPVVLSGGRISLRVSTEVSELTNQGALEFNGVTRVNDDGTISTFPGLTIPALNVRRASTTVELPSGGSIVMAGLIQDETRQNLEGMPGVKDIPVLGALFRSRDFENQQTELVIIATPYLVDPAQENELQTPDKGFRQAPDANTLLLAQINRIYKVPGAQVDGQTWQGPHGYVLE